VKNRVELSVGWQADAVLASDRSLLGTSALGGTLAAGATEAASRRLVDFHHVLVNRNHFQLQNNLDLLSLKFILPKGEIVVGRQVLSWGTGRFWNPTDLLSPFAPTDIDREVRHGVDAVRYSVPLSSTSLVDLLYLPQKEGWAQGGVARVQANARGFDVSVSAAKYVADAVFGADTAGDVGPIGMHAEIAYTQHLPNLDPADTPGNRERFVRAVAGIEWRPREAWVLGAEYYFNGFGTSAPSGYLSQMRSERVARGEVFGSGRHYLGLVSSWAASDLWSVQATALVNLQDPSAMLVPMLEWSAAQNRLLRLGAFIPLGDRPTVISLDGYDHARPDSETDALREAATTLGLRSEYGASAAGVMAQLAVYL
jgi:hypothetical protein